MIRAKAENALIALGSDLGDRSRHLRFAVERIASLPRTRLVRGSSFYKNPPVGVPASGAGRGRRGAGLFLNAVVEVRTGLSPEGLLVELKRLEALRGRRPAPRWSPRPLDCDLLFHGRRRIRTRLLRVPHPLALRRAFVLVPLAEILPMWSPPVTPRRTVRCWMRRSKLDLENVKWAEDPPKVRP
ncbi:MAG: 2-amino-4-hydroxy-6-hydroxymethyldihydropteridine diphosphokinase [Elusimicrobiota bacterium]